MLKISIYKKLNKGGSSDFNFYDFLNVYGGLQDDSISKIGLETADKNFFTKIPNELAKANLQKDYFINRIVLVVFTLIHRNMSVEGTSIISVRMVLQKCNYACGRNKRDIFFETVKAILFLADSGYIEISQFNPQKITYDECIFVTINPEIFLPSTNFTKLYWNDFDTIMSVRSSTANESLLNLFLYISAVIGNRPKNENGGEVLSNPSDHPEAFWQSITTVCENLSMARATVNDGLNVLLEHKLLVKHDLGFKSSKIEPEIRHYSNIYVLNKSGFEQEIQWAIPIVKKEWDENGVEK